MDGKLGVQHGHHSHNGISKPPVHHHAGRRSGGGAASGRQSASGKGIKVVYISSPMKLTASAEEFRAIVQELTGRDSNVADHDLDGGAYYASSSSSSSSASYYSFGRVVSPTAAAAAAGGARALSSPTTIAATTNAGGPVRRAPPSAMAEPPLFQFQGLYDQTAAGSLLYGQDYW